MSYLQAIFWLVFLVFVVPVSVYFTVKLARYAYLAAEESFKKHHTPPQEEEMNDGNKA